MPPLLRQAWFVGRKDLFHMLSEKETLLWVFVMPILFFYFIGTVTGGGGLPGDDEDRPDTVALRIVGPDGATPSQRDPGFLLDEIVRRLEAENFRVVWPDSPEEFDRHVRRLTVVEPILEEETEPADGGAGSREPREGAASGEPREGAGPGSLAGLTERVLAGHAATFRFDSRSSGPAASFDELRVARAVYGVLADLAVVAEEGGAPSPDAFVALRAAPRPLALRVESAGRLEAPPRGFAQTVPGTMVMFTMLVLLTSGSITLVVERRQGLLRRLASTPISPGSVVLGKWGSRMALGLVQIGFAMAAGRVLFGVGWGDELGMVFLVVASWAALNASLAILLGNLARTEAQMVGIGVLASMVLAALGGAWWPIEITPRWMQRFALFLPTGWAMDALHKLVNFGYAAPVAAPHVAAMLAAALALGWAGARTFRYQ